MQSLEILQDSIRLTKRRLDEATTRQDAYDIEFYRKELEKLERKLAISQECQQVSRA